MVVDAISSYDEMVSIEKNKINFEKKKSERKRLATSTFIFDPNSIITSP